MRKSNKKGKFIQRQYMLSHLFYDEEKATAIAEDLGRNLFTFLLRPGNRLKPTMFLFALKELTLNLFLYSLACFTVFRMKKNPKKRKRNNNHNTCNFIASYEKQTTYGQQLLK